MLQLEDLQWGDVLADTGEVLVLEALLDEDKVIVKRWGGTTLDAELTVRRLLDAAGVAQPQLLGGGAGWLVVEDLAETMWRPAGPADLTDPATVRALARWFTRVHEVEPAGLPRAQWELNGLVEVLADLVPPDLAGPLAQRLSEWSELVEQAPRCVVVGSLEASGVAVVGAGMQAMATDLSLAHGGIREEDLTVVRSRLEPAAWLAFEAEYRDVSGTPIDPRLWAAQLGIGEVFALLAEVLHGRMPGPERLQALRDAVAG